jgi:hypothetical protein
VTGGDTNHYTNADLLEDHPLQLMFKPFSQAY